MGVVGHVEDVHAEAFLGILRRAGRKEQSAVVEGALVTARVDIALDPEAAGVAEGADLGGVAAITLGRTAVVDLGLGHAALGAGLGERLLVAGELWGGAVRGLRAVQIGRASCRERV